MFGGDEIQAPARIISELGSQRPPFTRGDVVLLLAMAAHALRNATGFAEWLVMGLVSAPLVAAEKAVRQGGVGELEGPIRDLASALGEFRGGANSKQAKARARLLVLLQPATPDAGARVTVDPACSTTGDTWGVEWRGRAASLSGPAAAMIVHCTVASGVMPSKSWLSKARELAAPTASPRSSTRCSRAASRRARPRPSGCTSSDGRRSRSGPALTDPNVLILRGAIWAAATLDEAWPDER